MKQFNSIIYSVTEALPTEGPLEGELKGYTGKCLEEYAGKTVLARHIHSQVDLTFFSLASFGEEDLWYDVDTDDVIVNVTHWCPIPSVDDPIFKEAL